MTAKVLIQTFKTISFILIICSCDEERDLDYSYDGNYVDNLIRGTIYDITIDTQGSRINDDHKLETLNLYLTIGSLNADSNYIFGDIRKVLLFEGIIFLLDARSRQLKIFDLESGEHIKTFDLEGRGPGEILFPEDMIFDEPDRTLFILDRQRKLLKYTLDGYTPEITDEAILDYLPENFCMKKNAIVIRNRMTAADWHDETPGNITVYEKDGYTLLHTTGDFFASNNWLLTNQLSRGTIYCSEKDENLYSVDRYLPQLTIFKGPDFAGVERVLFSGLKLIKIVPGFTDGLPEISYDRSNGGAIVSNVIAADDDIFVQLYELLPTLEEKITTYQIDKTNYTLKRSFDHLGIIHQLTDSLMVTSVNTPYPRVEIYRHEGFNR